MVLAAALVEEDVVDSVEADLHTEADLEVVGDLEGAVVEDLEVEEEQQVDIILTIEE